MLCLCGKPVSHIWGTHNAEAAAPGGVSVALNAIARRGWAHRLRASAARAAARLLFIRPPPVGIRSSCEWRGAGADQFRRRARSVWLEMRGCGALLNILPVRVVRHGVDLAAGRREFDHAGRHQLGVGDYPVHVCQGRPPRNLNMRSATRWSAAEERVWNGRGAILGRF